MHVLSCATAAVGVSLCVSLCAAELTLSHAHTSPTCETGVPRLAACTMPGSQAVLVPCWCLLLLCRALEAWCLPLAATRPVAMLLLI